MTDYVELAEAIENVEEKAEAIDDLSRKIEDVLVNNSSVVIVSALVSATVRFVAGISPNREAAEEMVDFIHGGLRLFVENDEAYAMVASEDETLQ